MFNAEDILEGFLSGSISTGKKRKRKRRRRGAGLRGAAMSPQGLTLLGGIAIAAFEHFSGKDKTPQFGGAQSAQAAPPPVPGGTAGARPNAAPPSPPGATQPRAELPPLPPPVPGVATSASTPSSPSAADSHSPDAPGSSGPPRSESANDDDRGRTLVLAMVGAAKADGTVDEEEHQRIATQLDQANVGAQERAFVLEQLSQPFDFEALLARVGADATLAAEVYVASLLVIGDEVPAETAYLAMLAARLGLSDELVAELRRQVSAAIEEIDDEVDSD